MLGSKRAYDSELYFSNNTAPKFAICSYEFLQKAQGTSQDNAMGTHPAVQLDKALCGRGITLIILDDSQLLKDRSSQNWMAVKALRYRYSLLITDTPLFNNWSYMESLWALFPDGGPFPTLEDRAKICLLQVFKCLHHAHTSSSSTVAAKLCQLWQLFTITSSPQQ